MHSLFLLPLVHLCSVHSRPVCYNFYHCTLEWPLPRRRGHSYPVATGGWGPKSRSQRGPFTCEPCSHREAPPPPCSSTWPSEAAAPSYYRCCRASPHLLLHTQEEEDGVQEEGGITKALDQNFPQPLQKYIQQLRFQSETSGLDCVWGCVGALQGCVSEQKLYCKTWRLHRAVWASHSCSLAHKPDF